MTGTEEEQPGPGPFLGSSDLPLLGQGSGQRSQLSGAEWRAGHWVRFHIKAALGKGSSSLRGRDIRTGRAVSSLRAAAPQIVSP